MNQKQAIREQYHQNNLLIPASIQSTNNCLVAANGQEPLPEFNCGSALKNIYGQLLSVCGDVELPIEGACVEIHAVTPLKRVVSGLSDAVLAHCRTLLLETAMPVDLYHASGHVADTPRVSFADIQCLRDIPGYELLAAAARSQADASFRRLLCSNPAIAKLLLCYYHPASFSAVRMADAITDATGSFRHTVLESGNADERPGYLFIARRKLSSSLYITLYKPTPVAWHTYWSWPVYKAITLRSSHPLLQRVHTQH